MRRSNAAAKSNRRARAALNELDSLLGSYGPDAAARKLHLAASLVAARFDRASELQRLQRIVCFLSAFPDDAAIHRAARRLAEGFAQRVQRLARRERESLDDSAMAGTTTRHFYCAAAARWLVRKLGAAVEIDWPALDAGSLAPLLSSIWHPLEDEEIELTAKSLRESLARARGGRQISALGWLLAQAGNGAARERFDRAFDTAEVPLAWRLGDGRAAIISNRLPAPIVPRPLGLRRSASDPRAAILEPLGSIERLSSRAAKRLLDVWRAALWSRTRTVFQIEQPNLDECYLAYFGGGLAFAAVGVAPGRRGALEATYGYLLLGNGMPIGYGGFTALFAQVNTGINVFPEYRGSEAAFAFEQALRAMRTLTGCERFVVNPYQFGEGNDEALASGAYWFYYRLGFRSADADVRALAKREFARLRGDRRYRVPVATLRRLAGCDLYLDLNAGTGAKFFDERWLPKLARGITAVLAREGAASRESAGRRLAARIANSLGIEPSRWPSRTRRGFALLAPLLGQIEDLDDWTRADKQSLAQLAAARWAPQERDYIARLREHDRLRESLALAARRA